MWVFFLFSWQFIETWDRQAGKLLQEFTPYPNTYFGLGLLSRLTAKHSDVLACQIEGGTMQKWQRVFAAALRSPKGQLTLAVVNDAPRVFDLAVEFRGLAKPLRLYRYGVTAQDRDRADLQIAPQRDFPQTADQATLRDQLAARSITSSVTFWIDAARSISRWVRIDSGRRGGDDLAVHDECRRRVVIERRNAKNCGHATLHR